MALKYLISKLTSFGYSPAEIEYSLNEILQHKKPDLLNKTDYNILLSMLEERIQLERADQANKTMICY